MKFTVDLDNKKIIINDAFNRKELSKIFSILNIDDIENYTIDIISDLTYSSEPDNNNGIMTVENMNITSPLVVPYYHTTQ
jgi:hypothetical protein|tara:strand:+ start:3970 stop:4209 length:240 start_codon:yes stop_codon:yes gene_type:complete